MAAMLRLPGNPARRGVGMLASAMTRFTDRQPLWKVFWLYGVLPGNLWWIAVLAMLLDAQWPGATRALLVLLLGYTAWIVMAVWRAAPNARDPRYGVLARALTVVWAINTVLLVLFLELQLLR